MAAGQAMMIRKPLDLPPDVARGSVDAITDYFAEEIQPSAMRSQPIS
jgi:hypothetical protein